MTEDSAEYGKLIEEGAKQQYLYKTEKYPELKWSPFVDDTARKKVVFVGSTSDGQVVKKVEVKVADDPDEGFKVEEYDIKYPAD